MKILSPHLAALALALGSLALAHSHHAMPTPAPATPPSAPTTQKLTLTGAYVAAVPPAAQETALYFTLNNTGNAPLVLKGAYTGVASSTMLMTFKTLPNGQTSMIMKPSFTVQPGRSLTLSPSGAHVMLSGLKRPLKVGERLSVRLELSSGHLNVTVPVKKF